MPKLYTYFGLIVMFYSNEHEPVHVHGKYQGRESKAELIFQNGELAEIHYVRVQGKRPLAGTELQHFKELVEAKAEDIRDKWIAFFVDNMEIQCEHIKRRLK